jgi:hypothetical protein
VAKVIEHPGATMDTETTFLDCPAYINGSGTARCGLPAAVEDRYTLGSTDGAVVAVRIRCPSDHWFSGPVDALTAPAVSAGSQPREPLRA